MGSGWPRLRPGGRGCDGGGRAPRRLAEIAAWGGVGCRVRDGTRRVVGVIRGPVFHLPPLEHFRTLLPNADPRGPAGGHAQDGTVDGVCHADPTPRARSPRGAWSFCEISVIGLIRVGSLQLASARRIPKGRGARPNTDRADFTDFADAHGSAGWLPRGPNRLRSRVYAESRLTARTQSTQMGNWVRVEAGVATDESLRDWGNGRRDATVAKAVFPQFLPRFAAAGGRPGGWGVYLRILRSPLLRILCRSPVGGPQV